MSPKKNDWKAVACILIYGYLSPKYFPLNLSMGFVALFTLEERLSNDLLLELDKLFVSAAEKEILTNVLVLQMQKTSVKFFSLPTKKLYQDQST